MNRLVKTVAPAALVAGLTAAAVSLAQPPGRDADRPDRKAPPPPADRPPPPDGRRPDAPPRPPERLDAAAEAWVKTLTDRMTDPHDVIRDSARAGIVAVGPAAVPVLSKIAAGDDGAKATAARRLIDRIEHGDRRPPQARADAPPPPPPGDRPQPPTARRDGAPGDRPAGPPPGRPEGRPGPDGRPGAGGPIERALADLRLDPKAAEKVRSVADAHRKKVQELMEQVRDGTLERPAAGEKMRDLHAAFIADLKAVLTDDQFKKLHESLPPRPMGGPPGEPGRRPDGPPPGERRPDGPPPGERPNRPRPDAGDGFGGTNPW